MVSVVDRIVKAIGVQISAEETALRLADGINQPQNTGIIRVQKPTDNGIVIPALEVIETGIGIVEIAAVAEGVDVRDMGGVSGNVHTGPVEDGKNIPVKIILNMTLSYRLVLFVVPFLL